jgi:hypothetical protein
VELAKRGGRFVEIAGNDEIVVTVIAPRSMTGDKDTWFESDLLTDPLSKRVAVRTNVSSLHSDLNGLAFAPRGIKLEHIYDY